MDHRERVLMAVGHEEPDRVPLALWGSAHGVTDPLYKGLVKYLNLGEPLAPFRKRLGHSVNYYDDRVLEALDIDIRHVWLGFTDLAGPPAGGGIDAWGIGWRQSGIYLTAMENPLRDAGIDALDEAHWPDAEDFVVLEGIQERAKYLKENTDYAVVGRGVDSYGLFERCNSLRGMDQFMIDLALDEAFANRLIEKVFEVHYRLTEIYLDAAGKYLDIIELPGDDYAAQNPLISPAMFDKFFAPNWKRIVQLINSANPNCKILFHSDGRMELFLGRLIDMGIDIFHCLEPMPGVDMSAIKTNFGDRLCFWGAIDIKHALQGDASLVEAEVRERIRCLAPGGGYVIAPANHLQPDVPPENVIALYQTARRFGVYPITSSQD